MRNGSKNGKEKISPEIIDTPQVDRGSGNVFADLGLPNPDLLLAKAILVERIRGLIEDRKLTLTKASRLLGIDQPKVAALIRGHGRYSIDRLFRFLNALGQRVEVTVRPAAVEGTVVVK